MTLFLKSWLAAFYISVFKYSTINVPLITWTWSQPFSYRQSPFFYTIENQNGFWLSINAGYGRQWNNIFIQETKNIKQNKTKKKPKICIDPQYVPNIVEWVWNTFVTNIWRILHSQSLYFNRGKTHYSNNKMIFILHLRRDESYNKNNKRDAEQCSGVPVMIGR